MRLFEAVPRTSIVMSTRKLKPMIPSISPVPGALTEICSCAQEVLDTDGEAEFVVADAVDAIIGPQAYLPEILGASTGHRKLEEQV